MDLHDDIAEPANASQNWFVVPALSFPDTEPDETIENLARRKRAYVIWGTESLLSNLDDIVRSRSVSDALPMGRIAAEVLVVADGQIRVDAAKEASMAGSPPDPATVITRPISRRKPMK